ncbi:Mitochondrial inner membrane protein oxa1 [Ascosphaera acerosa]|nr:Mitochondrial inner membrane protein oxa1 [Ascosphaera acerosa]
MASAPRLRVHSLLARSQRQLSTFSGHSVSTTATRTPRRIGGGGAGSSALRGLQSFAHSHSQTRALSLWPFRRGGQAQQQQQQQQQQQPEPDALSAADTPTPTATTTAPDATAGTSTAMSSADTTTAATTTDLAAPPSYNGVDAIDSVVAATTADGASTSGALDLAALPDGLGYLHALGLDYGWGPSALMQALLETLHFAGGVPWWAAAVGASVLIRAALVQPTLGASDSAARLGRIKDQLQPLNERMLAHYRAGEQAEAMALRQQVAALQRRNGVQPWKAFLPLLQIPFAFGMFRVMRGMAELPVPGLEDEHWLWVRDMSVSDPYYALPVLTGGMLYLTLKVLPRDHDRDCDCDCQREWWCNE